MRGLKMKGIKTWLSPQFFLGLYTLAVILAVYYMWRTVSSIAIFEIYAAIVSIATAYVWWFYWSLFVKKKKDKKQ